MNYFKHITLSLFFFLSITSLTAQANCEKFESLKQAFKEENIESVCELDLSDQNLKELPDNIGNLPNLEILRLENNRLKSLPDSIIKSKKILRLHLDFNQFESVP